MNQSGWLAERFEDHRGHLRAVAFRMLGSLSEADDIAATACKPTIVITVVPSSGERGAVTAKEVQLIARAKHCCTELLCALLKSTITRSEVSSCKLCGP